MKDTIVATEYGPVNVSACARKVRRLFLQTHRINDPDKSPAWCREMDNQYENGAGEAVHAAVCEAIKTDHDWAYCVLVVGRIYANSELIQAAEEAFKRKPKPEPVPPEPCLFA